MPLRVSRLKAWFMLTFSDAFHFSLVTCPCLSFVSLSACELIKANMSIILLVPHPFHALDRSFHGLDRSFHGLSTVDLKSCFHCVDNHSFKKLNYNGTSSPSGFQLQVSAPGGTFQHLASNLYLVIFG